MLNRLVYTIKLHQQIQWKHARPVKQQRYRGFARSYLQPGKRERNTTKGWESFPGVMSGRLTPPSWLMFFFFFTLQTLCCWHSRVSPSPTEVCVDSAAQKQRHTHEKRSSPRRSSRNPVGVGANVWEHSETLPRKYQLRSKEYINEQGNSSNSRISKLAHMSYLFYFIFAFAYWEENQASLCQKRTKQMFN